MPDTKEAKKTADDFTKAYEELCKEYGFQVVANPQWIQRDDGSFSMVVRLAVVETPQA